jgi:hypothetical protein
VLTLVGLGSAASLAVVLHAAGSTIRCPAGTRMVEVAPPAGREQWCESDGTGVRQGAYRAWFANGRLKIEGQFLDGEKSGRWRSWHGNGLWFGNGQPSEEGAFAKGREEGVWTRWHRNGARFEEGEYRGGRRQGRWRVWYHSGELEREGQYRDSMPYGVWTSRTVTGEACDSVDLGPPPRTAGEPPAGLFSRAWLP